jgi:hypothetical protein
LCMQCMFCCVRLYNRLFYTALPSKKMVSSSHLPWMWVGVETANGAIISLTEIVDTSIEYGDCVDAEFLEELSGIRNAKRWIYLDSKTLKEEEIPTVGLIIEDDSDE